MTPNDSLEGSSLPPDLDCVAQDAEAHFASIESAEGTSIERLERVIAAIDSGAQPCNAAQAGGWTPDEFEALMSASPYLTRAVELAEARFLASFEIAVAAQTSNATMAKMILSSRGTTPLSDRKGHTVLDRSMEDESYELEDGDLDAGYAPRLEAETEEEGD